LLSRRNATTFASGLKEMESKCIERQKLCSPTIEERQKIVGELRDATIASKDKKSFSLSLETLTLLGYLLKLVALKHVNIFPFLDVMTVVQHTWTKAWAT
jgi:hypothetical protein